MKHKIQAQIRFNDIDILGHLNNTVYFSLYDLGKARYMEDAGLKEPGAAVPCCVIADIHCSYFKPVHFGDDVFITTRCSEVGEKSFVLEQEMLGSDGEEFSRCRTVMVYLDPHTGASAPVPEELRRKIADYENK